jgi:CubicO group peptidase (beta-lactamase class C family)
MWTYSDWNLYHLCHALAKVWGKQGFYDHYEDVAKEAYFDAIGMTGWSTKIVFDRGSQMDDGVRFVISLEHMGRLGLLALARGAWQGVELVPRWFVEELETKQTRGMRVNYRGPYDGIVDLDPAEFPEAPYGYFTWVNTDGDFFPGASTAWAWGSGAGGTKIFWNRDNGIVYSAIGLVTQPSANSIPHIIERALNP